MTLDKKFLFIFSIIKAILVSLVLQALYLIEIYLVRRVGIDEIFVIPEFILIPLLFIYVGYKESSKYSSRIYLQIFISSLLASALLFLNPLFWRESGGHPSLPNAIITPFIFIGLLISGWIGAWYRTRKAVNLNK